MMTDPDYICGESSEIKDWTQIKVTVKLEHLDTAVAVMSVLDNNLMVEDYNTRSVNLKVYRHYKSTSSTITEIVAEE